MEWSRDAGGWADEASKGAEQCWGAALGSECPLWGRAGGLICIWGHSVIWGWMPVCVWELDGAPISMGTQGLRGIPCSAVCAAGLCWQAASLHQLCAFISALHAGPWSCKAYHKGHIFNTAFNPTILRI